MRLGGGTGVSKARVSECWSRSGRAPEPPLPPDITYDLRAIALMEYLEDIEAKEHFETLRREADERAW